MTTGVPAPSIPSIETGTPPKEWSESILASNPAKNTPTTLRDPQANEGTPNIAERSQEDSRAAKGPTAPPHANPERQQEAPHVSLPSTELRGAQPLEHTSGVGALPGNLSESSVALLPEERKERVEARQTSRQRRDTMKPSLGSGEEEPRRSEKEGDETKIPRKAISTEVPETFQPSNVQSEGAEFESQEVSRQTKSQEAASKWASAAAVAATGGMVGTVGHKESGEKAMKDMEGSDPGSVTLSQQEHPSEGVQPKERTPSGKVEGGYGGEYHPAQLHPPPPGPSVSEYRSSYDQQEAHDESSTTKSSKRESVGGEKKPGLMTMMKGEMKIIAGKMSGDEHKIEEGKRLVHGDA